MTEAGADKKAADQTPGRRPRDFHFAFGFAVLAALLHASALVLEVTRLAQFRTLVSHTVTYLLLVIGVGLLVNVAGLWSRRAAGMVVSLGALSVVGVGYALWYVYSRQMLDLLMPQPVYQLHPEALPPHPLGLIGATWPNLVVLAMSSVLFVWEVKTLRGMKTDLPRASDLL